MTVLQIGAEHLLKPPGDHRARWRDTPGRRYAAPVPELVARIVAWLLLFVHAGLGIWALAGFIELSGAGVPWPSVTNPELPRWLLWLRWPLIAMASAAFIGGYFARWRNTPWTMLAIYSGMAAMCAYETLFLLTNPNRYRAMAIEYMEYAVILLFLFSSGHMQRRFSQVRS